MIGGWVLDADTLQEFASGSSVYAQAVVWTAVEESIVLTIPATALGRSITVLSEKHLPALDVLLNLPVTVVDDLTRRRAYEVGHLLAAAAANDLALGHAVRCAQKRAWPLVTGDGAAVRRLDPGIEVRELP